MQHIVPYTLQQNGVVEIKNRTFKKNSCIIQSKGLSLHYWEKEIHYENYIVNHTYTKDLSIITPKKTWSNIKLDVSHFCIFVSVSWAHIPHGKKITA